MRLSKVSVIGIVIGIVVGICLACAQVLPASIRLTSQDIVGGQCYACCEVDGCPAADCTGHHYKTGVKGEQPEQCSCKTKSENPCWFQGAPEHCGDEKYKYYDGDECGEGACTN